MRKPRQLTLGQRYQIAILRKAGHNQTQIARHLGVHKSTISRELSCNLGKRGYRPKQAQRLADARRNCSRNRIPQQTWIRVEQLLREDWSPRQITSWLAQNEGIEVSGVFQGSCRIFCFIRPNDYLPIVSMSNCFQS